MKINEITEEIVTRQSIIDAMVAKDWPLELQKEFETEALFKPPFSDGWEITAVRPVKRLNLGDYKLSDKSKKKDF